jgi:hypothetical protein
LARAQAAWIRRHLTLDPRLSRYSRRATTDELHIAIRILRGLFSLADADELTLSAALRFAAHLHDTAREAEGWGVRPALPLPHIWMAGAELDAAEAAVEADGYAEN